MKIGKKAKMVQNMYGECYDTYHAPFVNIFEIISVTLDIMEEH